MNQDHDVDDKNDESQSQHRSMKRMQDLEDAFSNDMGFIHAEFDQQASADNSIHQKDGTVPDGFEEIDSDLFEVSDSGAGSIPPLPEDDLDDDDDGNDKDLENLWKKSLRKNRNSNINPMIDWSTNDEADDDDEDFEEECDDGNNPNDDENADKDGEFFEAFQDEPETSPHGDDNNNSDWSSASDDDDEEHVKAGDDNYNTGLEPEGAFQDEPENSTGDDEELDMDDDDDGEVGDWTTDDDEEFGMDDDDEYGDDVEDAFSDEPDNDEEGGVRDGHDTEDDDDATEEGLMDDDDENDSGDVFHDEPGHAENLPKEATSGNTTKTFASEGVSSATRDDEDEDDDDRDKKDIEEPLLADETNEDDSVDETKSGGMSDRSNAKRTWTVRAALVCAIVFLILVIVIPIAIAFSDNKKNDSSPVPPQVQAPAATPTMKPATVSPTAITNELLERLQGLPPYTIQAIFGGTNSTPQSEAYNWLVQDPNLESYSTAQLIQRFVLATLYYATNGSNWTASNTTTDAATWLAYNSSECQWMPGACPSSIIRNNTPAMDVSGNVSSNIFVHSNDTTSQLSTTSLRRRVLQSNETNVPNRTLLIHHIILPNMNLDGMIPPELALLQELQTIELQNNRLYGPIPGQLLLSFRTGDITLTKFLIHGNSNLTGEIPDELCTLNDELQFDCTRYLCGCNCTCFDSSQNDDGGAPTNATFDVNATYSSYPVTDASQSFCYDSQGNSISCQDSLGSLMDGGHHGLSQIYCDHEDGTVTDLRTGLMWTKLLYGEMTITDASQPPPPLGGYDGWRLPSMKELYTLSQFNGFTGKNEDGNTPYQSPVFEVRYGSNRFIDGQVWSSNLYVDEVFGRDKCYFGFNPIDGRIKCYPRDTMKFVRYVRGSTDVGVNNFLEAGNTVIDAATGLQWMRADSGFYNNETASTRGDGTLDWEQALSFCRNIAVDGKTDWRLPDAHELHTLVDYSRSPSTSNSSAIDPIFESTSFINEGGLEDFGYYWTSTSHLDGRQPGNRAVYISFGRALGNITRDDGTWEVMDVHGAGAQRSDPKIGPNPFPYGHGPQGDIIRIYNFARCVRGSSHQSPDIPDACPGVSVSSSPQNRSFVVGSPIVGGVSMSQAIVGVRVESADVSLSISVQIKYSDDPLFSSFDLTPALETTETSDWTASAHLAGLTNKTRYYYRVVVFGVDQPTFDDEVVSDYSFTTMPPPGSDDEVEIAVFSDSGPYRANLSSPTYKNGAASATIALQIGDMDHSDPTTLGECRAMHQRVRDAARGGAAYDFAANVLARLPIAHVWNDRDYCGHDTDKECPSKEAAYQAFTEYWPGYGYPGPTPDGGIYHKFIVGAAEFFMLDSRFNRHPNGDVDDAQKTMLGVTQREWLISGLNESTAMWKVIISSVTSNTHASPRNTDHWRSFRSEVNIILAALGGINNTVFVTGDLHSGGGIDDGSHSWFGFPELGVAHTSSVGSNGTSLGIWSEGVTSGDVLQGGGPGYSLIRYSSSFLALENYAQNGTLLRELRLAPGFISFRAAFVCQDDPSWISNRNGIDRGCGWISNRVETRCDGIYSTIAGDTREASQACPVTCGLCSEQI